MGRTKKVLSDSKIEQLSIIAWRIRDERQRCFPDFGSSKECAKAMGVSPSLLSLWEREKRFPDDEQMELIAKTFGVTVEHLKTAPKNWKKIKEERALPASLKQNTPNLDGDPDNVPKQDAPKPFPVAANSGDITDQLQQKSTAIRNIIRIVEVDKMHDRGEISSDLFHFSMETISEHLTKLFKSLSKG